MDDLSTYYQVLGVSESASEAEIKSQYRKLLNSYHPDKLEKAVTDFPWVKQEAEERTKQIIEAWSVLGNPLKRQQYNEELKAIRQDARGDIDTNPESNSDSYQPWTSAAGASTPPPPGGTASGRTASGPPPNTAYSTSASSSIPPVSPINAPSEANGIGCSGCAGYLVLVAVIVLVIYALGSWLIFVNNNANLSNTTTASPAINTSQAEPSTPIKQIDQNGVRVRRITGVIYSYSVQKWGGNVWGTPGDAFPQIDLVFWSGLISGQGDLHWKGSYTLQDNNLCLTISGLQVPTQTMLNDYYSDVGVGYGVELENGTFGDYTTSRALILYRTFPGDMPSKEITKCFVVIPAAVSETETYRMAGEWEGTGGDVSLNMRIAQKGNRFAGSMIATQGGNNGQSSKVKVGIEGLITDGCVTFVRRDKNTQVYISYVAPFSKDDPKLIGTWYSGLEKGPWQMTRTGDISGELDDFTSPDFSNPPVTGGASEPRVGSQQNSSSGTTTQVNGRNNNADSGQMHSRKMVSKDEITGYKMSGALPVYPPIAKASRIEGTVLLNAIISSSGSVSNLSVINGPAMLQQSALDAVRTWHYKPYLVDGVPTELETEIEVTYKLSQ